MIDLNINYKEYQNELSDFMNNNRCILYDEKEEEDIEEVDIEEVEGIVKVMIVKKVKMKL